MKIMLDIKEIIEENVRRNARLIVPYDPVTGDGAVAVGGDRVPVEVGGKTFRLPAAMVADDGFSTLMGEQAMTMMRFRYDFEFWAVTCVRIYDKKTGRDIPFRLNRAQRKVLGVFESQRVAGLPVRAIILKARQWGCSTLVQVYYAWIQIIHRRNWNSIICAHVRDAAANIRGMYSKILASYPREYWDEDDALPAFKPFEGSTNTRYIPGRGCRVTLASSDNQDAARGGNYAMAHLSEVAFWKDSAKHSPEDFVRTICSGIDLEPMSCVVMESTANGVGGFFHCEWLRACAGKSDKVAIFVPWYELERCTLPVPDPAAMWESLEDYERALWDRGCTLEAINWYRYKRRETADPRSTMAEYPSDDSEAFAQTSAGVFNTDHVERLRLDCVDGTIGEIVGKSIKGEDALLRVKFVLGSDGRLVLWRKPRVGARCDDYIVAVDIGGRTAGSDYSVITVLDRRLDMDETERRPEIVAQWRGHTDHDLLAWKAAAIGTYYRGALLVIESNSLESGEEQGPHLLSMLERYYDNLYRRPGFRLGFHTNRATKSAIITLLVARVRDAGYVERDNDACNELLQYEQLPGGAYAARKGCHDDILITRAIALYIDSITPARSSSDFFAPFLSPRRVV